MSNQFWDDYTPDCPECKGYEREVLRLEKELAGLYSGETLIVPLTQKMRKRRQISCLERSLQSIILWFQG